MFIAVQGLAFLLDGEFVGGKSNNQLGIFGQQASTVSEESELPLVAPIKRAGGVSKRFGHFLDGRKIDVVLRQQKRALSIDEKGILK